MKKVIFYTFLHLLFGLLIFLSSEGGLLLKIFQILPVITSLYFYLISNSYTISRIQHSIFEYFKPTVFSYKIKTKICYDEGTDLNHQVLSKHLENIKEFTVVYPSDGSNVKVTVKNTEYIFTPIINARSIFFEINVQNLGINEIIQKLESGYYEIFKIIEKKISSNKSIFSFEIDAPYNYISYDLWNNLSQKYKSRIILNHSHSGEDLSSSIELNRSTESQQFNLIQSFDFQIFLKRLKSIGNLKFK